MLASKEEDYDSDERSHGQPSAIKRGAVSIDSRIAESGFGTYDSEQIPLNKSFGEQDCLSDCNKLNDNVSNLLEIDQIDDRIQVRKSSCEAPIFASNEFQSNQKTFEAHDLN